MTMKLSRRLFLRGAGGALLAIPWLESIAGAQTTPKKRRFVALATGHGGIRGANMHPAQATLTESLSYAGHQVRRGALTLSVENQVARLSPVLSGSSGVFTQRLAGKMNVLRGIDTPFYIAHTEGIHLGNLGNSANVPREALLRPTIDQVMAFSTSFYPTPPKVRSVNAGYGSISFARQNPSDPTSPVQKNPGTPSSLDVFAQIYTPPTGPAPRRPGVDQVLADYRRLRASPRLSSGDRARLDAHLARLSDYEARLNAVQTCGTVARPSRDFVDAMRAAGSSPLAMARAWSLFTDMAVIAFSCDTTRIFTFPAFDTFSDYLGADYHQEVAHRTQWDRPLAPPKDSAALQNVFAQNIHATAHQVFFEHVYLDLLAKLDAVDEGNGSTLLDSSLVAWTQESGIYTHDAVDSPVVLAGSAAGSLRTGSFCDYRNTARTGSGSAPGPFPRWPDADTVEYSWFGLTWNQYYGTVLQAMGLAPAEYEESSYGGYGPMFTADDYGDPAVNWPESVRRAAREMLPFLPA
ncbi:MAG: DUF1552 domain-containing protein [Myxococcota bacterium]